MKDLFSYIFGFLISVVGLLSVAFAYLRIWATGTTFLDYLLLMTGVYVLVNEAIKFNRHPYTKAIISYWNIK